MAHRRLGMVLASLASLLGTAAAGGAARAQTALDLRGLPSGGTVRLRAGFRPDPATATARAGGPVPHPECNGHYPARPAVLLDASANLAWLRVYATSTEDTSLAILGPDGRWRCADDTYGAHPSVDGRFRRGRHLVWVGTAQPGNGAAVTVTVTAQRRQHPPVTVAAAQPDGLRDPLGAATSVATQILGDGRGNGTPAPSQQGPLGVPLDALTRAGLDPNNLPASLGTLLRQDAGLPQLTPAQLGQLGDLARRGLDPAQLGAVADAMNRGAGTTPGAGTLRPDQLTQVISAARTGADAASLGNTVAGMLRRNN